MAGSGVDQINGLGVDKVRQVGWAHQRFRVPLHPRQVEGMELKTLQNPALGLSIGAIRESVGERLTRTEGDWTTIRRTTLTDGAQSVKR